MAARCALAPILAPILVGACVAATTARATNDATQVVHDAQDLRDPWGSASAAGEDTRAEVKVEAPVLPAVPPAHAVEESFEPKTPAESVTRVTDRARIEARGALRDEARIDAAASRAAVKLDNRSWTVGQRRELLAYLRGGVVDGDAQFTDADARTVAQLQAGSGAVADGVLNDETMAVLLVMGFRFSPRKAVPGELKLEFFPGELEDLEAWNREIETKITKDRGGFHDVNAPAGEGTIYVRVGRSIVASYRARGGPPSPLDDGDHVAVATTPGVYRLGPGRRHVTSNWYYSQIPWGAEIRKNDDGYQYRWNQQTKWLWATRHPAGTLKDPIATDEFVDLPEVTRGGETYWIWNKNDFGPIAWNLVPSALYIHTTPRQEAETAAAAPGAVMSLGFSHGCIHIDPRERDEMMKLGYLNKDILFVVRRWGEHRLPDEIRREMIDRAVTASGEVSPRVSRTETTCASVDCSREATP